MKVLSTPMAGPRPHLHLSSRLTGHAFIVVVAFLLFGDNFADPESALNAHWSSSRSRGSLTLIDKRQRDGVASSLLHVPHAFRPEFLAHFAV